MHTPSLFGGSLLVTEKLKTYTQFIVIHMYRQYSQILSNETSKQYYQTKCKVMIKFFYNYTGHQPCT